MKINVTAFVCTAVIIASITIGYAQQGPAIGACQDAQGNIVDRHNVSGQKCNGFVTCRPSNTCAPVSGPCPNGIGVMVAESSDVVAVGTCQGSGSSRNCNKCDPGLICALFTGYREMHPVSGNCFSPCGTSYQRGGDCN